jgi:hypothetical protein
VHQLWAIGKHNNKVGTTMAKQPQQQQQHSNEHSKDMTYILISILSYTTLQYNYEFTNHALRVVWI